MMQAYLSGNIFYEEYLYKRKRFEKRLKLNYVKFNYIKVEF